MVLKKNVEPGESEYSYGKGMVGPEERGYTPTQVDILRAEKRTDSTDPDSTANYTDLGNPDRYGGQPPLTREVGPSPASNFDPLAPMGIKGAKIDYKVKRKG